MLRDGVAAAIDDENDMVIVGESADGTTAIADYHRLRPDVTLMDLQMPIIDGVEAIIAIRRDFPQARIIVLTTYSGDARALKAIKAGAAGYLLKSSLRHELVDAIRAVHGGRRRIPPAVASEIADHFGDQVLSAREIDALQMVAIGHPNKQIAQDLNISEETVKAHLRNIFAKLGVKDRTHAVTLAAKRGIIDL
jgi:DNA-binding NarL/FixJ family response regulator